MAFTEERYFIDGMFYNIVESMDIHIKLQNDPDFALQYIRNNTSQLEFEPPSATENNKEDTFTWTQNAIQLLLQEYEKRKNTFRNPSIKKKTLWTEIKNEFGKHGYIINNEALDKKFRNMKKTYVKINDNNKKSSTGGATISWEYYNTFCNIFDNDKSVAMDNVLSSMVVMEENGRINPEVLDLPALDLTDKENIEATYSSSEKETTVHDTGKKSMRKANTIKRNYDTFRKAQLDIEKEKLQEAKKLHRSIDEIVKLQKERNKILADLSEKLLHKLQ